MWTSTFSSFLFTTEYHSIFCIYHSLLINSPTEEHFCCFLVLAIINKAAINIWKVFLTLHHPLTVSVSLLSQYNFWKSNFNSISVSWSYFNFFLCFYKSPFFNIPSALGNDCLVAKLKRTPSQSLPSGLCSTWYCWWLSP